MAIQKIYYVRCDGCRRHAPTGGGARDTIEARREAKRCGWTRVPKRQGQPAVRRPDGHVVTTRGTTNRNERGSAAARRKRRRWLIDTFGDGRTVPCAFECGTRLTIDTLTVDRYPIPGCQGGAYVRGNIRPACMPCNSAHGGATRKVAP